MLHRGTGPGDHDIYATFFHRMKGKILLVTCGIQLLGKLLLHCLLGCKNHCWSGAGCGHRLNAEQNNRHAHMMNMVRGGYGGGRVNGVRPALRAPSGLPSNWG